MVFTRLRAPYVNPEHFRFTIYRRGLFSDIAKWLGMQDIEVGHEDFDRDFIIKGTQETKLRALFDNPRLRELIAAQPQIHLTVKDDEGCWGADFPADTDELCFHVCGIYYALWKPGRLEINRQSPEGNVSAIQLQGATNAAIGGVTGMASGPDGSLFVTDAPPVFHDFAAFFLQDNAPAPGAAEPPE